MRAWARQQGVGDADWLVLRGDEATIRKLTRSAGFVYFPSPKGFDHLDQVTVVDAGGVVRNQVYGATFSTPLLVEPLKTLVFGTETPYASLEDLIKKVRLFCTIYDPAADRYRFEYSIFFGMITGGLVIGAMASFLGLHLWRALRRRHGSPNARA
jgi:protein SCO1/2